MKRLALLVAIFGFVQTAHASWDQWGSGRPAVWRSSRTCQAPINFVPIATGAVHLHAIVIESGTVNVDSFISIYNSTQNANGATFNFNISTAIFLNTSVNQNFSGANPQAFDFDVALGSGAVVNKQGGACVNVLWDYYIPNRAAFPVKFNP